METINLQSKLEYIDNLKLGQKGYFNNKVNPVIFIGETETHLYVILLRNNTYYGVFKDDENLKELIWDRTKPPGVDDIYELQA